LSRNDELGSVATDFMENSKMFWSFSLLLMVVWMMGMVTGYTIGGAIHVLPVFAVFSAFLGGLRRRHSSQPRFHGP
jgi:uncharacterized membrane protein